MERPFAPPSRAARSRRATIDLPPDFIVADHRDIPGPNYVALIDPDQPCLAER